MRQILRDLLWGKNPTFYHFIEITKDDWDTVSELLSGEIIQNSTEKYNNMVAAKEWTKTDPTNDKTIALTISLSMLEKKSVFATVQGGGGNITQTHIKTKVRDPNKIYFKILNNIEYRRANKQKENSTRDGQDSWWYPNHNMEGKFGGMYMNHPSNNHAKWD